MGICGQKSTPTALTLGKGTSTDHVSEWETPESVRMGDPRVGLDDCGISYPPTAFVSIVISSLNFL
jgi:hypothetical protein